MLMYCWVLAEVHATLCKLPQQRSEMLTASFFGKSVCRFPALQVNPLDVQPQNGLLVPHYSRAKYSFTSAFHHPVFCIFLNERDVQFWSPRHQNTEATSGASCIPASWMRTWWMLQIHWTPHSSVRQAWFHDILASPPFPCGFSLGAESWNPRVLEPPWLVMHSVRPRAGPLETPL